MSAIVDFTFYTDTYMGSEATQASFPALCARASDVVSAMTRYADPESMPEPIITLYKKAICSQVDYFAVNGLDSVSSGDDVGFTVGKVTVQGKKTDSKTGIMSAYISPLAVMYLEQTGLLNPAVPVAPVEPVQGWWF